MSARLAVNTAMHAKTFQANAPPARPPLIWTPLLNATALLESTLIRRTPALLAPQIVMRAQIRPANARVAQPDMNWSQRTPPAQFLAVPNNIAPKTSLARTAHQTVIGAIQQAA